MFGLKFRSWMESHIVRPRKKRSKEGGTKGTRKIDKAALEVPIPSSPFSTSENKKSQHETFCCNVNGGLGPGACSNVEPIALVGGRNEDGSPGASNNLSSPESAYSTGYSTDGTSPGHPPEYYINIRTGTHYFLPNSTTTHTNPSSSLVHQTAASAPPHSIPNNVQHTFKAADNGAQNPPTAQATFQGKLGPDVGHQKQKSGANESISSRTFTKQPAVYNSPSKVLALSHTHRRTESCGESRHLDFDTCLTPAPPPPLTASPRQRTRIRTNPWLSSNPRTSITSEGSSVSREGTDSFSSVGSSGEAGCGTSLRLERDIQEEEDRDSPISPSTSSTPISNVGDFTDDDLTLNEMMGKFDESYIYEKETDILSDSDPTDCDETDFETGREGGDERDTQDEEELDFIDNGSLIDLPMGVDSDHTPNTLNKGHCTYHDFLKKPRYRESMYRRSSARSKDEKGSPILKRPSVRKEHVLKRRSSRDGSRYRKQESNVNGNHLTGARSSSDKKRTRSSVRKSVRDRNLHSKIPVESNSSILDEKVYMGEIESGGGLNLNRILTQKLFARGVEAGTQSAGNTPISLRRRVLTNDIRSPKKLAPTHSNKFLNANHDNFFELPMKSEFMNKKRSNSVSYPKHSNDSSASNGHLAAFVSELALIEADKEADLKYKQLILEAENILTTMKDQIPINGPKSVIPKPKIFTRNIDLKSSQGSSQVERKIMRKAFFDKNDCQTKIGSSNDSVASCHFNTFPKEAGEVVPVKKSFDNHVSSSWKNSQCTADGVSDELPSWESDGSSTPQEGSHEDCRPFYLKIDVHSRDLPDSKSSLSNDRQVPKGIVPRMVSCNGSSFDKVNHNQNIGKETKTSHQWYRPPDSPGRKITVSKLEKSKRNATVYKSATTSSSDTDNIQKEEKDVTMNLEGKKSPTNKKLVQKMKVEKWMEPTDRSKVNEKQVSGKKSAFQNKSLQQNSENKQRIDVPSKMVRSPTLASVPQPPLVAFRAIDLGNALDSSNYCPQSEPVKRKVYSCSATFDRLQKSLAEREDDNGHQQSETGLESSRSSLREKLQRLRERDEKEGKFLGTRSPDLDNQRKLSLLRRKMLVNTIEGLKRNLEDQSAKLKATYCSENIQKSKEDMAKS